jgi:hypothetical protein
MYPRALIAVKPLFRIMPVPVAVLTKAGPSFQQTRINLPAQILLVIKLSLLWYKKVTVEFGSGCMAHVLNKQTVEGFQRSLLRRWLTFSQIYESTVARIAKFPDYLITSP